MGTNPTGIISSSSGRRLGMKKNKVPTPERLRHRIAALESKYDARVGRKKGNPYNYCKDCGLHAPEISNRGHQKGCPQAGLKKEIGHYRKLLWGLEHEGDFTHFYYNTDFL